MSSENKGRPKKKRKQQQQEDELEDELEQEHKRKQGRKKKKEEDDEQKEEDDEQKEEDDETKEYDITGAIDKLVHQTSWTQQTEGLLDELYKIRDVLLEKSKKEHKVIYPPADLVFTALHDVEPDDVRVLALGMDVYIRTGQAEGRAFSVPRGTKPLPPSLRNILDEARPNLPKAERYHDPCLDSWGAQKVLLLNACLTVNEGVSGSHTGIWEKATRLILRRIAKITPAPIFLCWGRKAMDLVTSAGVRQINKHLKTLTSMHPSPLATSSKTLKPFKNNGHFTVVNKMLVARGEKPIVW
jgi:uracil-DNA glycosylase